VGLALVVTLEASAIPLSQAYPFSSALHPAPYLCRNLVGLQ